ncbi:MAG TPA: M14 family metallopeptidase [Phenylobacterium sp.]|nr:M14 family metallopeptidase [Phenylobacterium sp.]
MNSAESFSSDYQAARAKFLGAASGAGAALEAITHPERGPEGGELTTDVAWIGPRSAEAVLVMISATHGVEGFCGSGAQVDWLRREEFRALPDGIAALLVHAINPYGFAWLRRVTHENVDLNRNWVDFNSPRKTNPGYEALADRICPIAWTAEAQGEANQTLKAYADQHGPMALQQALSGGQYSHPLGIFYGGDQPTWSRRTQTSIYEYYLRGAGRIGIIDYHTGLGPWGYGEQIVVEHPQSASFKRAASWYGSAITSPLAGGDSSSAEIVGDGLSFAPSLLSHADVTGMALEFGTKPVNAVLNAVRADAWLHAYGDLASPEGKAIKAEVRDAFFGDTDDWKGMIAGQSLLATRQALKGLKV